MTTCTIIIPHMVMVAVVGSDADLAEKIVIVVVVVVVSAHNAMEKFTATRMAIATIREPIEILLVRITIILLPSPTC